MFKTRNMNQKYILTILFSTLLCLTLEASNSVAGLYQIEGSGRQVYNFNNGWRFIRSDVKNAEETNFDDSNWK